MIRAATALAAIAALTALPALAETRSFDAKSFDSIEARGAIEVIYTPSGAPSMSVEQTEGDFSDLYLDFEGKTLVVSRNSVRDRSGWFKSTSISMKDGGRVVKVNGKRVPSYTVRVSGPVLDAAKVASSATLDASGLNADEFDGRVSSSGKLTISGTADRANLSASSSGDLIATNFLAAALDVDVSSSADVEAAVSGISRVNVSASSSGDVTIRSSAAAEYYVDASSSADVALEGSCKSIEINASSSGDVEANQLACLSASVQASSGADVSVSASESVYARASSGGDVYIVGEPAKRDVSKSSGGDVDFGS